MAKTEHYLTHFEADESYHVYNRTVDESPLFTTKENCQFFLKRFDQYLSDVLDTYCYCLLGNHFHFLVRIKTEGQIKDIFPENDQTDLLISHQFRKFFQSYSMAFNRQEERKGTLFQTPFKRAKVLTEDYLIKLVCYIHTNAQKHGFVKDFKNYEWSSYHRLLTDTPSKLCKQEILALFDGKDNYIRTHEQYALGLI